MYQRFAQQHVACKSYPLHPLSYVFASGGGSLQPCRLITRLQSTSTQSRRTRSSAPVTEKKQTSAAGAVFKAELPAQCFVDNPSFSDPSFGRQAVPLNIDDVIDLQTTKPAPVDAPPPLASSTGGQTTLGDRVKYLFKLGRAYASFYKTGFKNVWENYKQYKRINGKISPHPLNEVAKYGSQARAGTQLPTISRTEYQLCHRTRHDLGKLVPFSLVFIICGEFTPFAVALLGSRVVPYTCRLPKQITEDVFKTFSRDREYGKNLAELGFRDSSQTAGGSVWQLEWLEAWRYGLTKLSRPLPIVGSLYHSFVVRPRLVKHCDNLLADTILITREGGFSKLPPDELFNWAQQYGLYALREWKEFGSDQLFTEEMKRNILPAVEKEAQYILDQDWTRLKPEEHWRTTFQTVGSNSPDWRRRASTWQ